MVGSGMHETQTQLKQALCLGHLQGSFSHAAVLVPDDVGYHSAAFPTVRAFAAFVSSTHLSIFMAFVNYLGEL